MAFVIQDADASGTQAPAAPAQPPGRFIVHDDQPGLLQNLAMGALRGGKDVLDTGAEWLAKGFDKLAGTTQGAQVQAMDDAGKADFEANYGGSAVAKVGRVAGNIATTLPVGGAIAAPLRLAATLGKGASVLAPLADAVGSAGMTAKGAANLPAALAYRTAGGAITGGTMAGLVDPNEAGTGALVGGALPSALGLAGRAGGVVGDLVKPFLKSGQDRIASDLAKKFATNSTGAAATLQTAAPLIPGSLPTAVQASGDEGLASLSRTLQNASNDYASNLSTRQAAQNAARTDAIDQIAGNPGKVAVAQAQRDAITDPMREAVLARAGDLPAQPLADKIQGMLLDPDNSGNTAQQALKGAAAQLARITADDGTVNARALYEMRKDNGLAMQGKLSGDAGNLRYAKGQLSQVNSSIDDAIERASQRMPSSPSPGAPGTALTVPGTSISPAVGGSNVAPGMSLTTPGANIGKTLPGAESQPITGWRDYLSTYANLSKPIDQMNTLSDVMKRIQNGNIDKGGNLVLSAPKLNTILKNEGDDLSKTLTAPQMQTLRNLSADLNSAQLAQNSGKAVGSNTMQNLSQNQLLEKTLGKFGASTPATSIVGHLLKIPYGTANTQILGRVGDAMLNPAEAARLLNKPDPIPLSTLMNPGVRSAARLAYRAAPVIVSNPNVP